MTYEEAVDYLYRLAPSFQQVGRRAYKEGLGGSLALDDLFGHPHRRFRSIHIAGTNGKGSVAHTLAAMLQAEGFRVGLYTSPHLLSFRERIRVDGVEIGKREVSRFVERYRGAFEPLRPSFFELTTALAFKHFAEQGVDWAVVETGLGGRLDSTNIITPELSVITNIALDHTDMLGSTLAQIAGEKAGIIKRGVPVVVGQATEETRPVFEARAREMGAEIVYAQPLEARRAGAGWMYGDIYGELGGDYQPLNAATILAAARRLGIGEESIRSGFAHVCRLTGLRGRWEQLREEPRVVCDTGHNPDAFAYLVPQIEVQEAETRRLVLGMVGDKDWRAVVGMLPRDAVYYFVKPSTHRALDPELLAEAARARGLRCSVEGDVMGGYKKALRESSCRDFVFVGGSSYVVSDLLAHLRSSRTKL